MSDIRVFSVTQRIVINPATGSVSVINAGPMGPTGPVGPSEASVVLTTDGQILTRAAGVLAPITRAALAADIADDIVPLTTDGQILTRAAGVLAPITRANLASDIADDLAVNSEFTSRYMPLHPGVTLTDAAQSIANATVADITWGTEVTDPDGWTSGGSATLTVPTGKGGRYIISYNGQFSADSGTLSSVACLINGVALYGAPKLPAFVITHTLTFVRTLVAGDTLKFQAYQNSGAALDLVSRLEIL